MSELEKEKSEVLVNISPTDEVDFNFPLDPLVKELYDSNVIKINSVCSVRTNFVNLITFGVVCIVNSLIFGKDVMLDYIGTTFLIFQSSMIAISLLTDYFSTKELKQIIDRFIIDYTDKKLKHKEEIK